MPINQKRFKVFFKDKKGRPIPVDCEIDSRLEVDPPTSWRQWWDEKARLVTLANEAIRAWEAEHNGLALKAGPDPQGDEQPPPEGVVTPRILRRWIQERSGVDCIVKIDMTRGTFSVEPMHAAPQKMGFYFGKVDE
jgi:hypothetical protein